MNLFPNLLKVKWRGPSASLSAHAPCVGAGGGPQTLAVLDPVGVVRGEKEEAGTQPAKVDGQHERVWELPCRSCER